MPSFPQKGWDLLDVRDVREEDDLMPDDYPWCAACCSRQIRHVHLLRHLSWPNTIEVGCHCSERLITGYVDRASEAERAIRNHFARRSRFPKLLSWEIHADGSEAISVHGHCITLNPIRERYQLIIDQKRGKKFYSCVVEAKKVAFDYLWPRPTVQ